MTSLSQRPAFAVRSTVVLGGIASSAAVGLAIGAADHGALLVGLLLVSAIAFALLGRIWGAVVAVVPVLLTSRTDLIGPLLPNLVLALLGIGAVIAYTARTRYRLVIQPATFAFWGFSISVLALTALSGGTPVQPSLALAAELTLGLLLGQMMRDRNQIVGALGIVTLPFAALAIGEVVLQRHLWPQALNGHGVALEISGSEGWRAVSSFGHPLVAGGALAIVAVLTWSAWQSPHRWWISAVLLTGSLATVSRSSLLALAGALIASLLFSSTSRTRRLLAVAGLVGLTGAILSSVPALRDSYDTRVFQSTESQTLRARSAQTASTYLREEPLRAGFGQGIGTSNQLLARTGGIEGFTTFDNQYIALLYDVGWVAMVVFAVWGLALVARTGRKSMSRSVPALTAAIAVALFTDSLTWASLAVLTYTVLGFAIARPRNPVNP